MVANTVGSNENANTGSKTNSGDAGQNINISQSPAARAAALTPITTTSSSKIVLAGGGGFTPTPITTTSSSKSGSSGSSLTSILNTGSGAAIQSAPLMTYSSATGQPVSSSVVNAASANNPSSSTSLNFAPSGYNIKPTQLIAVQSEVNFVTGPGQQKFTPPVVETVLVAYNPITGVPVGFFEGPSGIITSSTKQGGYTFSIGQVPGLSRTNMIGNLYAQASGQVPGTPIINVVGPTITTGTSNGAIPLLSLNPPVKAPASPPSGLFSTNIDNLSNFKVGTMASGKQTSEFLGKTLYSPSPVMIYTFGEFTPSITPAQAINYGNIAANIGNIDKTITSERKGQESTLYSTPKDVTLTNYQLSNLTPLPEVPASLTTIGYLFSPTATFSQRAAGAGELTVVIGGAAIAVASGGLAIAGEIGIASAAAGIGGESLAFAGSTFFTTVGTKNTLPTTGALIKSGIQGALLAGTIITGAPAAFDIASFAVSPITERLLIEDIGGQILEEVRGLPTEEIALDIENTPIGFSTLKPSTIAIVKSGAIGAGLTLGISEVENFAGTGKALTLPQAVGAAFTGAELSVLSYGAYVGGIGLARTILPNTLAEAVSTASSEIGTGSRSLLNEEAQLNVAQIKIPVLESIAQTATRTSLFGLTFGSYNLESNTALPAFNTSFNEQPVQVFGGLPSRSGTSRDVTASFGFQTKERMGFTVTGDGKGLLESFGIGYAEGVALTLGLEAAVSRINAGRADFAINDNTGPKPIVLETRGTPMFDIYGNPYVEFTFTNTKGETITAPYLFSLTERVLGTSELNVEVGSVKIEETSLIGEEGFIGHVSQDTGFGKLLASGETVTIQAPSAGEASGLRSEFLSQQGLYFGPNQFYNYMALRSDLIPPEQLSSKEGLGGATLVTEMQSGKNLYSAANFFSEYSNAKQADIHTQFQAYNIKGIGMPDQMLNSITHFVTGSGELEVTKPVGARIMGIKTAPLITIEPNQGMFGGSLLQDYFPTYRFGTFTEIATVPTTLKPYQEQFIQENVGRGRTLGLTETYSGRISIPAPSSTNLIEPFSIYSSASKSSIIPSFSKQSSVSSLSSSAFDSSAISSLSRTSSISSLSSSSLSSFSSSSLSSSSSSSFSSSSIGSSSISSISSSSASSGRSSSSSSSSSTSSNSSSSSSSLSSFSSSSSSALSVSSSFSMPKLKLDLGMFKPPKMKKEIMLSKRENRYQPSLVGIVGGYRISKKEFKKRGEFAVSIGTIRPEII